ncbi:MAG: hypothetical protein QOH61_35 [Chloroflexota bacterium]|jgi:hypothetical protein|nr:hypothetical protein [Chloroflexota bacterium]
MTRSWFRLSRSLRRTALAATAIVALVAPTAVSAAPPGNDDFANATVINYAALPYSTSLNPSGATDEGAEHEQYCGESHDSLWWRFAPTQTGVFRADTIGSDFSTQLDVFRGTTLAGLADVDCNYDINTDDPDQYTSRLTFKANAGSRYYIRATTEGVNENPNVLVLHLRKTKALANDDYANAKTIPSLPFETDAVNINATSQSNEPRVNQCDSIGLTRWYAYTPQNDQTLRATTIGSEFDTILAAYTGASIGTATQVACNDDTWYSTVNVHASSITFKAKAGVKYRFQVGGYYGNNGRLPFRVEKVAAEPNDDFANAMTASPLPFLDHANTQKATRQSGEVSNCEPAQNTVWYKHTAADTDPLHVFATSGGVLEPVVAVWTGTSVSSLTIVDCGSSVTFTPTAGQVYRFQMTADAGRTGPITFHLEDAP